MRLFFFTAFFMMTLVTWGQKDSNRNLEQSNQLPLSPSGIECKPSLHVRYFRTNDIDRTLKSDWKVIVGHTNEYSAGGGEGSIWTWNLVEEGSCSGLSNKWTVENVPSGNPFQRKSKTGETEAFIPHYPMPISNTAFGKSGGVVKVGDGVGYSCIKKDESPAEVEIFYEKDLMTNPDGNVPNWFYYWAQELHTTSYDLPYYNENDPSSPLIKSTAFSLNYSNVGDYAWDDEKGAPLLGRTSFRPIDRVPLDASNPNAGRYATDTEIIMTLGEGTSKMCAHLYNRVVDGITKEFIRLEAGTGTGNTGISCFNEVFHHELEHIVIWGENWDKGFVDIWDKDGDLYSDEFEIKMIPIYALEN